MVPGLNDAHTHLGFAVPTGAMIGARGDFVAGHVAPRDSAEAITRERAVVRMTRDAAYAEFAEREKGTLAPGMLADLAVLSQDVFTVPAQALPATRSVLALVGGTVVHDAPTGRAAGRASH